MSMFSKSNAEIKSSFVANEYGSVTVWATAWTVIFLIIGGLAVDAGNAWRTKGMLQATADAAALAGAIELRATSDVQARAEAIRIANLNLGDNVLRTTDIVSGSWSFDTRTVNTAATLKDAVQVTTRRTNATNNALPTFLLKLVGMRSWDVAARATAQRFIPRCIRDGLTARGRVEVSSNNNFVNDICLHGQAGVKISSNNYFEAGVKVTMPDLADLQIPASGLVTNAGLEPALGENWNDPKIVDHINEIITALQNPASLRQPAYVNRSLAAVSMTGSTFNSATSLAAGRVYNINCTGGQAINIKNSVVNNVVITTNCKVSFSANSQVTNAIIATSNTSTTSMNGSAETKIGADDNCAPGGGAQLITAGSMHFSAKLNLFGSQVIVAGNVTIAAQAGGIQGASIQSGGDIKLTSNSSFGLCTGNVDQVLFQDYYRLVS